MNLRIIANQNRILAEKKHRDLMHQKESIVKIAAATQRHIVSYIFQSMDRELRLIRKLKPGMRIRS